MKHINPYSLLIEMKLDFDMISQEDAVAFAREYAERCSKQTGTNTLVVCSVCSSKLDENGECYKCLRDWAISQSG